jgi:S-DNA-T family DNA segregation ATPase FtsK/SpoIIIE
LLITATNDTSELSAWINSRERCAVLVDDAELVHGSPVDDVLVEFAHSRAPGTLALVVAGLIDGLGVALRGVLVEAKRGKQGVLLSPTSAMDGNALGAGISRELLGRGAPGRALMAVAGEFVAVQLPVPPSFADRSRTGRA